MNTQNQNQNIKVKNNIVVCKYCASKDVVKYGSYESKQRYWCKVCKRKFIPNDSLFRMKTPAS